jgi:hypothetical protein
MLIKSPPGLELAGNSLLKMKVTKAATDQRELRHACLNLSKGMEAKLIACYG